MKGSLRDQIIQALKQAAAHGGIDFGADINTGTHQIQLDYPENPEHGDFSTNIAMAHAKKLKLSPTVLAEKIVGEFTKIQPDFIESVSTAGPGFINFKIKDEVINREALKVLKQENLKQTNAGQKIMIEYTDPNPFKVFHIGHLMSNAIGESISRLIQSGGAEVVRACYQGDVGLHVAKTIWAIQKMAADKNPEIKRPSESASVTEKVKWLGDMYVYGVKFDDDEDAQIEITAVNKKIFEKSDVKINRIYEEGKKWSLEYFRLIYKRLGTTFDKFFFESEVADAGVDIVKEFAKKDAKIFKESEGAIVFPGEDYGLHTRVFITSSGLPTYETKELGLNTRKFQLYPDLSQSIIVTAAEQNDYFRVLLKAFSLIDPKIADKTKHISHGMMRFASGKMSSRKGNIISAEALLEDIRGLVTAKISTREGDKKFDAKDADELADIIAIGAIKYTILRQAIGGDVIFDSASSVSFEGDSGPYLQYSAVRAGAILEKAKKEGIAALDPENMMAKFPEKACHLSRLLTRFLDLVERARAEYAPQLIAGYLINLASAFNSFYASQQVVDAKDPLSPYYIVLTSAFREAMVSGLWLLGIKVPERM